VEAREPGACGGYECLVDCGGGWKPVKAGQLLEAGKRMEAGKPAYDGEPLEGEQMEQLLAYFQFNICSSLQ
jgi:hypothetical protein